MDPLSICTSVVTLTQLAATTVTSLHGLGKTALNAESHISALCAEIATLTGFLSSVEDTLKECKCQSHLLVSVDVDFWRQCELAVMNCQITLSGLKSLVDRIKDVRPSRVIWRARIAIDLSIHARELESFRGEINKSNSALQTILHTITVSLSLRSNISQDLILFELDMLKSAINDAMNASRQSSGYFPPELGDRSGTRVARNLRDLAKAAHRFHSVASSTAGTIQGESSVDIFTEQQEAGSSEMSELTPMKRERLHNFIHGTPESYDSLPIPRRAAKPSSSQLELRVAESVVTEPEEDLYEPNTNAGSDGDAGFLMPVVEVLEEFALENMKRQDFGAATRCLEEAIAKSQGSQRVDDVVKRLRIRLALCYLFQRNRRQAESVVNTLAECNQQLDLEVCNLMHTLALAHLAEYLFDRAKAECTRAIEAKHRLLGKTHPKTLESMALLATIYDMSGNIVYQEATRRQIPQGFEYLHPRDELEFLLAHTMLLPAGFQYNSGEIAVIAELDDGVTQAISDNKSENRDNPNHSRKGQVKAQLDRLRMLEIDTSKEVVMSEIQSPYDEDTIDQATDLVEQANSSHMKRCLTQKISRILRAGTLRYVSPDTEPNSGQDWFRIHMSERLLNRRPKSTSQGSSLSCGDRGWFSKFWPRRMIRYQSSDYGSEDTGMRIISWMREHQYPQSTATSTYSPEITDWFSTEKDIDHQSYDGDCKPWSVFDVSSAAHKGPLRTEPRDSQVTELWDTSPPAELHDTSTTTILGRNQSFGSSTSGSLLSHSTGKSQHCEPFDNQNDDDSSQSSHETGATPINPEPELPRALVRRQSTHSSGVIVGVVNSSAEPHGHLSNEHHKSQVGNPNDGVRGTISPVRWRNIFKLVCLEDCVTMNPAGSTAAAHETRDDCVNQLLNERSSITSDPSQRMEIPCHVVREQASCTKRVRWFDISHCDNRETIGITSEEVSMGLGLIPSDHATSDVNPLRAASVLNDASLLTAGGLPRSQIIRSSSELSISGLRQHCASSSEMIGNLLPGDTTEDSSSDYLDTVSARSAARIRRRWSWATGDDLAFMNARLPYTIAVEEPT